MKAKNSVLVVEDDAVLRGLLVDTLDETGCDVRTAVDSGEALALLATWTPDVILLDFRLPGRDGYQLRQEQRRRRLAPNARVLVMSAESERARIAARLGDAFMAKPFELQELVRIVRELTEPKRRAAPDSPPSSGYVSSRVR